MRRHSIHCVDNWRRVATLAIGCCAALLVAGAASAQQSALSTLLSEGAAGPAEWTSPGGLASTLQVMLMLTVVSLAPAILLMTTSYVRIVVVLSLLRQAIGSQQLPPTQVITSLALFMTVLLMTPVWRQTYDRGIQPYTSGRLSAEAAFHEGVEPIRRFMAQQIQQTGNDDNVYLFLKYVPEAAATSGGTVPNYVYYDAKVGEKVVPLQALLPAFMLSELKTAFLIGFQIFLPFVILDIVVATVTTSMGMMMLPPSLVSLPFKLLLFVLVDGWHLVAGMLLESFRLAM